MPTNDEQHLNRSLTYRIIKLPKGNGKFRSIYCIDKKSKKKLRSYLKYLEAVFLNLKGNHFSFGFIQGRNCALNALQHTGYHYTLSFDIQDFFDAVTPNHVMGIIDEAIIKDCFINGAPQQGLPTSPMIANIAFVKCDQEITNTLNNLNVEHAYSRYADDMTFSTNNKLHIGKIKFVVKSIVERNGFKLNARKTRLQSQNNGRVIITGIGVDKEGLHPTRKTKKKLRAAIHQQNVKSAQGLKEWSSCKLPASILTPSAQA